MVVNWTSILDKRIKPTINKRIILGRYDFGFTRAEFTGYVAQLKHPASESAKYHPDYHHWLVETPEGSQCWEIAATDQWTEINEPEMKHGIDQEEARASSQGGCERSEEEGKEESNP